MSAESLADGPRVPELDVTDEKTSAAVARALGEELRRTREARGWSRTLFVQGLPSKIGDRTLLSYEHGTRHMTVLRLVELSQALEVPASTVVDHALQRARLALENLVLRVDLRQLLQDRNMQYRPMHPWARNRLMDSPNGIIGVSPDGLQELAAFLGRAPVEMSAYLAQFVPDDATEEERDPVLVAGE